MREEGLLLGLSTGINAARGSVRDGLASLQNFEHLLRSPRVGPRLLRQLVAESYGCCAPLRSAFGLLVAEIERQNPDTVIVPQLVQRVHELMAQLDAALLTASHADLGAKSRLTLEAQVRRLSAELAAVHRHIDLLELATRYRTTELELVALIDASINAVSTQGLVSNGHVLVHVHSPSRPAQAIPVLTDPRVALPLMGTAFALVADPSAPYVSIRIRDDGDVVQVTLQASSEQQAARACSVPRIDMHSLQVAELAAHWLGAIFEQQDAHSCAVELPVHTSTAVFFTEHALR